MNWWRGKNGLGKNSYWLTSTRFKIHNIDSKGYQLVLSNKWTNILIKSGLLLEQSTGEAELWQNWVRTYGTRQISTKSSDYESIGSLNSKQ